MGKDVDIAPGSVPRGYRWLAVGLVLLPVILDLVIRGGRRTFAYFAADAFYYFVVARNTVGLGEVTFDQVQLTNGFHPLWQGVVAALFGMGSVAGISEPAVLTTVLVVGLLCVAAGLSFTIRAIDAAGISGAGVLLMPVGAYAFLVSPLWWILTPERLSAQNRLEGAQPLYGTLWSYANGMESCLALLFFGLLLHYFVSRSIFDRTLRAATFGFLLALLILARLDHAFVAMTIVLGLLGIAAARRSGKALRTAITVGACAALPIVAYVLINLSVFGSALPVSGKLKSTFPHLTATNVQALGQIVNRIQESRPWLNIAWRQCQQWIPFLVAVALLVAALMRRRGGMRLDRDRPADRLRQILLFTAAGVCLLALHNYGLVPQFKQGHWYYPISTLFVSIVVVLVLARWRQLDQLLRGTWGRRAWAAFCVAITLLYFLRLQVTPDYHDRYTQFYFEVAPRVRAHYGTDEPRLLCNDDGIVAFATGFPTMNAKGLNIDAPALPAAMEGRLGELAVERGFDRVTSLVYWNPALLNDTSPEGVRRWILRRLVGFKDPDRFDFELEYRSELMDFVIVRVRKHRSGTPATDHDGGR